MSDFSNLEKLAKGANAVAGDVHVEMTIASEAGPNQEEIDAVTAFMGAATPAAVLELIAENERLSSRLEIDPRHSIDGIEARDATIKGLDDQVAQLKAENERLRKLPTCWSEVIEQSEANDQLLDQVLELSKDAERYRFIVDCPIRTMVALSRKATEADFDLSAECDQLMSKIAARAK